MSLVQITTPQDSIFDLAKWIHFYRQKEIFVDIREQKTKTGATKYTLWRMLTGQEQAELAKGLTEIQLNTLVIKVCNKSVRKLKSRRSNKRGK